MSRPQISTDFGNERLVTQARPVARVEAQPGMQAWEGLAKAFAAGDLLVENNRKRVAEEDEKRARAYANSMTVDELGKAIKNGQMLASESPVFAATVQHIWGENRRAAVERDVMSKVGTGELKFDRPEDIDRFLTESRNTELGGQSKYAVTGFDKGYADFRSRLMATTAQHRDKAIVEQAATEATDSLANVLNDVTAPAFEGDDKARAAAIMDRYHLLRKTKVMPDAASRGALEEVITRAAASGKASLVETLLETELPDLGTVRAVLGENKAGTLLSKAQSKLATTERERIDSEALPFYRAASEGVLDEAKLTAWGTSKENAPHVSSATISSLIDRNRAAQAEALKARAQADLQGEILRSEYEAQKRVEAAAAVGRLWEVQGTNTPRVLTKSGEMKDFDVKGYAEQYFKRVTEGAPFEQQVSVWSQNGLINPDWDKQLKAGLYNLATISLDSKGKPVGELNEAGQQAIELFKRLHATSPDAARTTAGEEAYKRFSDIAFLTNMGRSPSEAAAIASSAAGGAVAGSPAHKLEAKIAGKVAELLDTPWMDWLENKRDATWDAVRLNNPLAMVGAFAGGVIKANGGTAPGLLRPDPIATTSHNTTPNTAQVSSWVKRYANLLAHSGHAPDAETALAIATEYVGSPEVSVKVNGTLYLRSELPPAPQGGDASEWLGRFLDAVPKVRARELGFAASETRMEFDERSRVYRAYVGGLPMTNSEGSLMVFSRGDIGRWYAAEHKRDVDTAATDANYATFRARVQTELRALQSKDKYLMERYDKTVYGQNFNRNFLSREGFEKVRQDGNLMLPLEDLLKAYPGAKSGTRK